MIITPTSVVLCILCSLITAITEMLIACVVTDNKPSWRAYGWFALTLVTHALLSHLTHVRSTVFYLPQVSAFLLLPLILAFRLRGWHLAKSFLIYFAIAMLGDFTLGASILSIGTEEFRDAMRYYQHPICILGQFIVGAGALVFTYLYSVLRRIRTNRDSLLIAGRFLRILLTLCIASVLSGFIAVMNDEIISAQFGNFLLFCQGSIALLFVLAFTYLVQDVKYIILHHQNRELKQQQDIQDALLHRSRMFHHNLANILCGLQGTIQRRDFDAIDEYCQDIVKRCQIINNENVQALRQIPRPAVSLLIQQKILDANEAGIPFYVHIDDGLVWHGWRDVDMCQLLGVLLDNAREAAVLSDAPYILLELHDLRGSMELVVRNTWGEKPTSAQSANPTVDTAPSRGLGLSSVQTLRKRYPKTTFSLYTQGRYVEAHLIF